MAGVVPRSVGKIRPRLERLRTILSSGESDVAAITLQSSTEDGGRKVVPYQRFLQHRGFLQDGVEVQGDGSANSRLSDSYGRTHNYVRISLTDKCNLRCTYCMPEEGIDLTRREDLMTEEEILRMVGVLDSQLESGSMKIRLTGGEPLLHPKLPDFLSTMNTKFNPKSIGITTNAILLDRRWDDIKSNLSSVNVSLDTLDDVKFQRLTRRTGLKKVLRGIERTEDWDGKVKLNCVVMKGFNDGLDDFKNFLQFQKDMGYRFDIRFIEWMPFDGTSWGANFVSAKSQMQIIEEGAGEDLVKVESKDRNDTTKWYRVGGREEGEGGRIGFITSMSDNFCGTCNRIRITSDGGLKVCLFDGTEVSLRDAMRDGLDDDDLARIVSGALWNKKFKFGGAEDMVELSERVKGNRHMTAIGG